MVACTVMTSNLDLMGVRDLCSIVLSGMPPCGVLPGRQQVGGRDGGDEHTHAGAESGADGRRDTGGDSAAAQRRAREQAVCCRGSRGRSVRGIICMDAMHSVHARPVVMLHSWVMGLLTGTSDNGKQQQIVPFSRVHHTHALSLL